MLFTNVYVEHISVARVFYYRLRAEYLWLNGIKFEIADGNCHDAGFSVVLKMYAILNVTKLAMYICPLSENSPMATVRYRWNIEIEMR